MQKMISGIPYEVTETRGVFKAENERYIQIATDPAGHKVFIKNWIKDHFIRGVLEYVQTMNLNHRLIIRPLNFGINQTRDEASIVFPYIDSPNLLQVTRLTSGQAYLIKKQLMEVVSYLIEKGYKDGEFSVTDQYYRDTLHNVMDNGFERIRYGLGASNILWIEDTPQILLIDFEREDLPWPSCMNRICDLVESLVK